MNRSFYSPVKRQIANRFKRFLASSLIIGVVLGCAGGGLAQYDAEDWVKPGEPAVLEKLEQWQDIKFGLFMHWGAYSQWGVVESWTLCTEDWVSRDFGRHGRYDLYKEDYRNLYKTFNPVAFDPGKWRKAAEQAGMKYVVFTTKHHDGFCMFDTKTTGYRITSPECAFSSHPRADITKEIFDSFRKHDFMIGAYFSKPDWDCKDYWWPYYSTGSRHVNYDPAKHPERWQRFKDHTYRQIEELMTNYGTMDMLWLDGAWVRPYENTPEKLKDWAVFKDWDQDVDIPRIAKMARGHQPGLIVVDRWVSGPYENYLTPENKVPEKAMLVPWESCMTMAEGWSYNKDHRYKSTRQLVRTLVDVVAKGGNLLLNVGPSPEGDWAPAAYDRLKGIGDWMKVNSEAIYASRPVAPYKDGKVALTRNRHTGAVYGIYLADENEDTPPEKIWLNHIQPTEGGEVTMLGVGRVVWKAVGNGMLVEIPERARRAPPCKHAWTIKIEALSP